MYPSLTYMYVKIAKINFLFSNGMIHILFTFTKIYFEC